MDFEEFGKDYVDWIPLAEMWISERGNELGISEVAEHLHVLASR
jgi:hypothetical protein